MIQLFCIEKPFFRFKNKYFCLQSEVGLKRPYFDLRGSFSLNAERFYLGADGCGLAGFDLDWSRKCDHAGVKIYISTFFWWFTFYVYDCRHWDEENEAWETH